VRLLVVDASGILPWRVRHTLGDAHELVPAATLEEAARDLAAARPDAAVVDVPHASLPWRDFHARCARAAPAVPVLYASCLPGGLAALGLAPDDPTASFVAKPATPAELARALGRLLADARRARALSAAPRAS
jgi:DNA-binding NtrC family response regulator